MYQLSPIRIAIQPCIFHFFRYRQPPPPIYNCQEFSPKWLCYKLYSVHTKSDKKICSSCHPSYLGCPNNWNILNGVPKISFFRPYLLCVCNFRSWKAPLNLVYPFNLCILDFSACVIHQGCSVHVEMTM